MFFRNKEHLQEIKEHLKSIQNLNKNKMENLKLVIGLISEIKETNKNIKKAKVDKIKFYTDNVDKLNLLTIEQIESYNFNEDIIRASFTIQKFDYFKSYKYKLIDKLEIHKFSPEQNKLIFRNGKIYISVPNKTELSQAIAHIIRTQSLEQIKSI